MCSFQYLQGEEYMWTPEKKILTVEQTLDSNFLLLGHRKMNASESLDFHIHSDTFEFSYMVKGQQSFSVEDQDLKVYGSEMLIIPPNVSHGTGGNPFEKMEMYWFQINCVNEGKHLGLSDELWLVLKEKLIELGVLKFYIRTDLKPLFHQTIVGLNSQVPLERMYALFSFYYILQIILNTKGSSNSLLPSNIQQAVNHINANICDELSLDDLAHVAHLSLSRFKEQFRLYVGTTPREYINCKKIEKAKQLLLMPQYSVTDVAMMLGFSSSNYFSVVFKQITTLSPSEYVHQCRTIND